MATKLASSIDQALSLSPAARTREGGLSSLRGAVSALIRTRPSGAALALRLALGLVMLPHGAQKLLGWFGGYGFEGTMGFFTRTMGIPWPLALAAILAESVGAAALLLGLGTRLAAAAIGTNMVVAALTSHVQHGFFMNWFGAQAGEGIEYHLLAAGMALALVIVGGGTASVDARLGAKRG
jgi:putative oxidoreductase